MGLNSPDFIIEKKRKYPTIKRLRRKQKIKKYHDLKSQNEHNNHLKEIE